MTNSKNTRRALLTSVMALVLCFAMLTGTTFAWFTDTETSSGNKIVAGKLDVDLLMYTADQNTDDGYSSIAKSTKPIFGEGSIAQDNNAETLWEPGKTQVAFLAIRNIGNLALKYNVIVDVTDNGLIGALEYAIVPVKADANTDLSTYTWETIKNQASDKGDLAAGKTIAAPKGCLDEIKGGVQNETDYFALAIHMKEEAGNEYKEKSVTIDITVNATQVEAEADSFGPNYDQGLEIVKKTTETVTKDADNKTTTSVELTKDEVTAEVPAGVLFEDDATEATLVVHEAAPYSGITIESDAKVVSLDISVYGVSKDNTAPIEVTLEGILPTGLTSVTLYHNGEPMTGYTYDPATGNVTFSTATFSNFTMVCYEQKEEVKVETIESLADAIAKGGEVTLTADVALEETLTIPAGVSLILDLGGKTISAANSSDLLVNNGILTITNGTIENTQLNGGATVNNKGTLILDGATLIGAPIGGESGYPAYCVRNSGNLTVEAETVISADRGCLFLSGTGSTTINGGTFTNNDINDKLNGRSFTSHVVVIGYGANNKLTINDGTFTHNHIKTSGGVVINNWSAVTVDVKGGNFSGGNYHGKWDNLSDYGYGSTKTPFYVTGGTFTGMDAKFIAEGYKVVENEDGTITVISKTVHVDTAEELQDAVNSGADEVVLDGDIDLSQGLVIGG